MILSVSFDSGLLLLILLLALLLVMWERGGCWERSPVARTLVNSSFRRSLFPLLLLPPEEFSLLRRKRLVIEFLADLGCSEDAEKVCWEEEEDEAIWLEVGDEEKSNDQHWTDLSNEALKSMFECEATLVTSRRWPRRDRELRGSRRTRSPIKL